MRVWRVDSMIYNLLDSKGRCDMSEMGDSDVWF